MMVFTHRPGSVGWEYECARANLQGAARSLAESAASAEHAARHYMSRVQGYPVLPQEARYQVEHVVCEELDELPPPRAPGRFASRQGATVLS